MNVSNKFWPTYAETKPETHKDDHRPDVFFIQNTKRKVDKNPYMRTWYRGNYYFRYKGQLLYSMADEHFTGIKIDKEYVAAFNGHAVNTIFTGVYLDPDTEGYFWRLGIFNPSEIHNDFSVFFNNLTHERAYTAKKLLMQWITAQKRVNIDALATIIITMTGIQ